MLEHTHALSPGEESELVFRARQNDNRAKEALVVALLPRVRAFAFNYKRTHYAANGRIDVDDLCQQASLWMWEHLSRALDKPSPCGYLLVIAFSAIRRYSLSHRSLITTPDEPTTRDHSWQVESFDVPVNGEDDGLALLDVLAAPAQEVASESEDHTPLYQAIEQLPKGQKSIVVQRYGLHETPVKDFPDLCRDLGVSRENISAQHKKGLYKLQKWLASAYSTRYDNEYRPCTLSNPATTVIPPEIQARLEEAFQKKGGQWTEVDALKLRRAAKVEYRYANAYLRQREAMSCVG